MKLITLNIWGGHLRTPLLQFIKTHQETDVFCFQEVYHRAKHKVSDEYRTVSLNIYDEIAKSLPNHTGFFTAVVQESYGIATFIKDTLTVKDQGKIQIHENPHYKGSGPTHSRVLQWLQIKDFNKTCLLANVHGLWNGKGKTDTPARINQSRCIKHFLDSFAGPTVLCGDFNLRPDTESMTILEDKMQNLIRQFNITSTRTSYYLKPERYADYILVSNDIGINNFSVLPSEVSDHAPLLVDFNV